MFHIFVALPDLYIVLFHIIKTYSSFWLNDIYGIHIEFVILPRKVSGFLFYRIDYHNLFAMAMLCRVDISFPK